MLVAHTNTRKSYIQSEECKIHVHFNWMEEILNSSKAIFS